MHTRVKRGTVRVTCLSVFPMCSRKYPYPSHWRFFKFNPHPTRNSLLVSYFHSKNLAFETPLPLGIFINLPWGGCGYFLELHNASVSVFSDAMSTSRAQTHSIWSGDESTNHKATVPPTYRKKLETFKIIDKIRAWSTCVLMCSSRKYPYFPLRRDWNFPGSGGFCEAKTFIFKVMYEA